MEKLILASGSPRRRELLTQAGIPFEVIVSNAEERITKSEPGEIVEELSCCKAQAVAKQYPDRLVLGSDTVVVLDKEILGKPKNEEDAVRMLTALQGRVHQVYTGVAFIRGTKIHTFHEKADVYVYPMSAEEIRAYVDGGDPMDKAGAYGIQGSFARYIEKIQGEYNTIVGLPIGRVYQELKKL
ncbi:MAG: Maf family protein [Eubacteriales bacterium]|nr:Maf family protein [Eubacteriales bacterium]